MKFYPKQKVLTHATRTLHHVLRNLDFISQTNPTIKLARVAVFKTSNYCETKHYDVT